MQTKELRFRNRSGWESGPWDAEPDKVQWPDPTTGLPCLAVRNWMGAWCGYVGVVPGHRAYGLDYDHEALAEIRVHGGLTFAADEPETGICHVPDPGEPAQVWWLGFDCAHYLDWSPAGISPDGEYRTLDYVRQECADLAAQLAAMRDATTPT